MSRDFFDTIDELDKCIREGPHEVDFERDLEPLIREPSAERYFFDQIEDRDWIDVLLGAGVFQEVPRPRTDSEGGVSLPSWSASSFLRRVSETNPEIALKVLKTIPPTDNPRVHKDLIHVLLNAAPNRAAESASDVERWASGEYLGFLADDVAKLAAHLAEGGCPDEAIALCRVLLEVGPPTDDAGDGTHPLPPRPRAKMDSWQYNRILNEYIVEQIAPAAGRMTVVVLCDTLSDAVRISERESQDYRDHSYIWHPAVSRSRDPGGTVRSDLVTALRQVLELLVEEDEEVLPRLVEEVEQRQWTIFRRIALYALSLAPDAAREQVNDRLGNRELFDEVGVRKEYSDLLSQEFERLPEEHQQTILGWIEEGPDIERYRRYREEVTGEGVSLDELDEYRDVWERNRLALVGDGLPAVWAERLAELEDRLGPAEDVSEPYRTSGVWVGPTSPKSGAELEELAAEDLVAYLEGWGPSDDPQGPSREGLGRSLAGVVAERCDELTPCAEDFRGLAPEYLAGFFRGIERAAKNGESESPTIHWEEVIKLARWVVDVAGPVRGAGTQYAEPHWEDRWKEARRAVLTAIQAGFGSESSKIPTAQSDQVWAVLEAATSDPDPSSAHEEEYRSAPRDAYTIAINTVRGSAIGAVIRFGLWLHRAEDRSAMAEDEGERLFADSADDIFELLDHHLDVEKDPSLAVRSVYGRWYPWLLLMDEGWTTDRTSRIFSQPDQDPARWEAVWSAYILFCPPYDAVLEALETEYEQAISGLSGYADNSDVLDEERHLASHLMTFYWRGHFHVDAEGNLLQKFFDKASGDLRRHAVEFVGRSLSNTPAPLEDDIRDRLEALYRWRSERLSGSGVTADDREELGAFAAWFVSGQLDDQKMLSLMIEALDVGAQVDWGMRRVVARLADLGSTMPLLVAQAISGLVANADEDWHLSTWKDELREALVAIEETGNERAREEAVSIADELGRRGFIEFRDLSKV